MGEWGKISTPLLALLILAGCGPRRPAYPPVPPQDPRSTTVGPQAPARPTAITADAAGPIRLGMSAEEVQRLPDLTVQAVELKLEGQSTPSLSVTQFGVPMLLAELEDGRVSRIRVFSDRYRTPERAHVGATARRMREIYGPGRVASGEGNVCATFERAPGRSFCFDTRGKEKELLGADWDTLIRINPRVKMILVIGADGD
jgi:hypothetical protein